MKTLLKIDLDALLSDEHNQREMLGHLMAEDAFLDSFVTLVATGYSNEGSHPAHLDKLREKLHLAMGDTYHAEAMKRVQDAEEERDSERSKRWDVEHRLKEAQELLPRVVRDGGLHHNIADSAHCDACRFVRAIRGES